MAAAARRRGERSGPRPTAVEALLGLLCLLTLVVLASALRRLGLYEDAYGFTVARLLGHAATLWVGAVLLLVLVAGALRRSEWLPRTLVGVSGAGLLALSLVNPEGLVAERNVDRFDSTGKIDLDYLARLSPDASTALAELPAGMAGCVLRSTAGRVARSDGPFELNVARARSRRAVAQLGRSAEACP